ncbi:FAD-dependent oxidoreductase [Polyangium aurulentum]|uniref:FAD-dependent oxidoreductase n=1 Tax=Polyangium aurulentum TaxID=2567896 RepID=UPI00198147B2|nr:FAD-dependent oxidoreductase [Polyangium aurulentum]UQA60376.1 NAD(P)-binding protein [Polyangium aurulentum]
MKVAIVGGGCAAMAAAFELSHPRHGGRYEITVYQMGFRLGGKGASGRGTANRIEEHGLHLWMGFYENAFRLMRECYAELGRDARVCPIADWKDAFVPAPHVGVTERSSEGRWYPWVAHFPPGHGMPGDPLTEKNPFTVRGYMVRAAQLVVELLRAAEEKRDPRASGEAFGYRSGWPSMAGEGSVVDAIDRLLKYGQLATMTALLEAAELLRSAMQILFPRLSRPSTPADLLIRLVDAVAVSAERQIGALVGGDGELRRVWELIDLVLSILRGCLRFGLAFHPAGFDAIDEHDWRDWLRMNGASESALDSAFMRGIYDLMFAYEDGDVTRPRFAAGVALRGALRMFFTYRGSLFFRMTAGMGDVVFAPIYEVLKRRGVSFQFFHRLRDVSLVPAERVPPGERPWVERLTFDVQAEIVGGKEYEPLVDVHGLPCWPSYPDYRQLVDGERLAQEGRAFEGHWETRSAGTKILQVTDDFDLVVLGVGLGAVPHVARELIERSPAWKDMVTHVKTVATQAFQIWMTADMAELGWESAPVNISGFVEPFDTWADMTHLIPAEGWRGGTRSIAYFCSVLPDPRLVVWPEDREYAAARHAEVREHAVRFLNHDIGWLWPKAARVRGEFRWEVLTDEGASERGKEGEARFDTQYWKANVDPTDRYVLSLPGTTRYRISPLELTFDNLTVAGDWTASGLNSGCVESAVMSGLLAAHAIAGSPRLEDIIGYDHP